MKIIPPFKVQNIENKKDSLLLRKNCKDVDFVKDKDILSFAKYLMRFIFRKVFIKIHSKFAKHVLLAKSTFLTRFLLLHLYFLLFLRILFFLDCKPNHNKYGVL